MTRDDAEDMNQGIWEKKLEEQDERVAELAREFISGEGSLVYRRVLSSFLKRKPRGLYRLNPEEKAQMDKILE